MPQISQHNSNSLCYIQCACYVLYQLTVLWKHGHYSIW